MRSAFLVALVLSLPHLVLAEDSAGFVEVPGGRIHYEAAGSGPVVVLLHDGLVDRRVWDGVWEDLAKEFRVVRYDRRGYGESPAAQEPYVPRDDLRLLLDHLEIPTATLAASSAGGDLALRTAFAYPGRIERLVLIGPVVSGLGFSQHFQKRNGAMMAIESDGGDLRPLIQAWLADPYLTSAASVEGRAKLPELLETSGGLTKTWGMERGRRAFGHLEEILVPTLVLVGEEDHPDLHAHAGAIQAAVRGAKREVIAGTGHLLALENPEALLDIVLPFLREPIRSSSSLDFRISSCLNLYFHVRSLAAQEETPEGPEEILQAAEVVHDLQEELGKGLLAWGAFDNLARECTSVGDLATRLERIPEPLELFGGKRVSVRSHALALGKALRDAEEVYQERIWQRQEEGIRQAVERLEEKLEPRLPEALAYHFRNLGIPDPGVVLPAYFVHSLPWPGAVTQTSGEAAACFLATSSFEPDLLLETVLHEATHGFLHVTRGSGTIYDSLRKRLTEDAGLSFRDRRVRDIPHGLMFIQSGETVRRMIDPSHVHYGVVEGYYDRIPLAREEVSIWVDHLDGALSREQALARLLALVEDSVPATNP